MFARKILCLFVITVTLVSTSNASAIMEKIQLMRGVLTKCSSESSLDIKDFGRSMMSGNVESCVMACVIKNMNLLDGGQFDLGKIENNFINTIPGFGVPKQKLQSAKECIQGIGEMGEGQQACVNAEKFLKCLKM